MAILNAQQGFLVGFGLAMGLTTANYKFYTFQPYGRTVKQVLVCLKCGSKNSIENKFCWECGHPFYPRLQKCQSAEAR